MRLFLRNGFRWCVFVLLALQIAVAQQSSQLPSPAGMITSASNARIGSGVLNGTTIFSGDLLKTAEGGRLQVQSGTVQFVFGPNSSARIFRTASQLLVELERGSVFYSAKGVSENLILFAQDIKFVPQTTEPAVGQITSASRCDVRASPSRSTPKQYPVRKHERSRRTNPTASASSPWSVLTIMMLGSRRWRIILNTRVTPITTTLTITSHVRRNGIRSLCGHQERIIPRTS
jgi:hypothetical protein